MKNIVIIGAGFAGLTAALDLLKLGHHPIVIEADTIVGGLAGSFDIGPDSQPLEKFYHHWFTNDEHVVSLIDELGEHDKVVIRDSHTGMYFNNTMFRLASPLDVLRFTPLPFIDRIRLGLLVFQVRMFKDWRKIEHKNVPEWLVPLSGQRVYDVVWGPLVDAKFSIYKDDVTAAWFWKKLQLRGSSRGKGGSEQLAYYKGGFAALAERMAEEVRKRGGDIRLQKRAVSIRADNGRATGVELDDGSVVDADAVLVTTAFPIAADLLESTLSADEIAKFRRVRYLANRCLALELDRSLSDTYWLNVNDPSFPFVGVIEHTNFEPASSYGGRHIVYLSRYLAASDAAYSMGKDDYVEYALGHLQRMFPDFKREWILGAHVWDADYAQPVTERNYSHYLPGHHTSLENVDIYTMAQIYPEDRGTNYAVREGRAAAAAVDARLERPNRKASRETAAAAA